MRLYRTAATLGEPRLVRHPWRAVFIWTTLGPLLASGAILAADDAPFGLWVLHGMTTGAFIAAIHEGYRPLRALREPKVVTAPAVTVDDEDHLVWTLRVRNVGGSAATIDAVWWTLVRDRRSHSTAAPVPFSPRSASATTPAWTSA